MLQKLPHEIIDKIFSYINKNRIKYVSYMGDGEQTCTIFYKEEKEKCICKYAFNHC